MDLMCFDIINSSWYITHEPFSDPLREKSWITAFLKKWELESLTPVDEGLMDRLTALRSILTEAAHEVSSGKLLSEKHMQEINRYLELGPYYDALYIDSGRYGFFRKPVTPGWDYAAAKIVRSFVDLISDYDVKRLKLCGNPECNWVFYDASKNSTRRWCGSTCASLIKVRRFRSRQKQSKE